MSLEKIINRALKNKVYSKLGRKDETGSSAYVSLIVGCTLQLIDDALQQNIDKLVFISPESETISNFVAYLKAASDIEKGRLGFRYDVSQLKLEEKYKYKNCIVEYAGLENISGEEKISFKLKNGAYTIPKDIAPKLQSVETNRKLSKLETFKKALNNDNKSNKLSDKLIDLKTHNEKFIYYIPTVINHKGTIEDFEIEGKTLYELLHVAKINSKGEPEPITGQLDGNPSIVLGKDLFDLQESTLDETEVIKAVIISANSESIFHEQLQQIDELIEKKIPVILITNFELASNVNDLQKRGFLVWTWRKDLLKTLLHHKTTSMELDEKAHIFTKTRIRTFDCSSGLLKDSFNLLKKHKKQVREVPHDVTKNYDFLLGIAFERLRQFLPIPSETILELKRDLAECSDALDKQHGIVPKEFLEDLKKVSQNLQALHDKDNENCKRKKIIERLNVIYQSSRQHAIPLIIDNKQSMQTTQMFLKHSLDDQVYSSVKVMYAADFLHSDIQDVDVVLSCWFKKTIMKKFVYGNKINDICLVLYDKEKEWAFDFCKRLARTLDDNEQIEHKLYQTPPANKRPSQSKEEQTTVEEIDELNDLELTLVKTSVDRYVNSASKSANNIVFATLVYFEGGHFAFFSENHRLLKINSILQQADGEAEEIKVDEARPGDFILIRESEKNLVREMADHILEKSDMSEEREISSLWRAPLRTLVEKYGEKEAHRRLEQVGCHRTDVTIRQWIRDEHQIAPRDAEDIKNILIAAGRRDLLDEVPRIVTAKKAVNRAHKKAGASLSRLLRNKITDYFRDKRVERILQNSGPLEMHMDSIGTVYVYQISNIDTEKYKVNRSDVNSPKKD